MTLRERHFPGLQRLSVGLALGLVLSLLTSAIAARILATTTENTSYNVQMGPGQPPEDPMQAAPALWDATDTMLDAASKATVDSAMQEVDAALGQAMGRPPQPSTPSGGVPNGAQAVAQQVPTGDPVAPPPPLLAPPDQTSLPATQAAQQPDQQPDQQQQQDGSRTLLQIEDTGAMTDLVALQALQDPTPPSPSPPPAVQHGALGFLFPRISAAASDGGGGGGGRLRGGGGVRLRHLSVDGQMGSSAAPINSGSSSAVTVPLTQPTGADAGASYVPSAPQQAPAQEQYAAVDPSQQQAFSEYQQQQQQQQEQEQQMGQSESSSDPYAEEQQPDVQAATGPLFDKFHPQQAPQAIILQPVPTPVPAPPQQVAAAAAPAPGTPTVVGSGGIKVVTSDPVSISNPISIKNPNSNGNANKSAEQADMGFNEYKLSSTLRQASSQMQTAANEMVDSDISSVEKALKNKLRHTEQLKSALQTTLTNVLSEIDQCGQMKASMEQRLGRVMEKVQLNEARLQVRKTRPARERTMDDVEGVLIHQQGLMMSFVERVKRAIAHLEREMQQLEQVRRRLEADLRDKLDAIDVDSKTLNIQPDGSLGEASTLHRKPDVAFRTPSSWVSSTDDNIKHAHKWLTDSARLRKAIKHAMHDARMAEHEMSRALNAQMLSKIGQTKGLKGELEKQLGRVVEELSSAHTQRESLVRDLEAKRGPLQQAKERLQARKARPDREIVQDEVEAALTREVAHLNSITVQLSNKLNAVEKTISNLDLASLTLEDNIRDKETTLSLDERVALLDGRINLNTAPPSSVASFPASGVSGEVREATLRRINDLEAELQAARKEREALEGNIVALRSTLSTPRSGSGGGMGTPRLVSSPKGPLSPTRFAPLQLTS